MFVDFAYSIIGQAFSFHAQIFALCTGNLFLSFFHFDYIQAVFNKKLHVFITIQNDFFLSIRIESSCYRLL